MAAVGAGCSLLSRPSSSNTQFRLSVARSSPQFLLFNTNFRKKHLYLLPFDSKRWNFDIVSCLPSSSSSPLKTHNGSSTKLFVSGLSFRTTEESLRNAFKNFGNLVEVNLVMDKIAKRPRGFAFLRYATEEESNKAIEGMHGKFLDGRVIFVEVAKSRSELRQGINQNPGQK